MLLCSLCTHVKPSHVGSIYYHKWFRIFVYLFNFMCANFTKFDSTIVLDTVQGSCASTYTKFCKLDFFLNFLFFLFFNWQFFTLILGSLLQMKCLTKFMSFTHWKFLSCIPCTHLFNLDITQICACRGLLMVLPISISVNS